MAGRVLVVDDVKANVRLMEARLMAEYFQVLTASNGPDAIEICNSGQCDVVLLDVMMPGMDGFEVCRRLKADTRTMHIPVVMVTALDQQADRVEGLKAGADDFLTKPVNDLALIARVKSLIRLKVLTDELRLRAATGQELAMDALMRKAEAETLGKPSVLLIDDSPTSYERILKNLSSNYRITLVSDPNEALLKAVEGDFDAAILSLSLNGVDPLRLCAQLKSVEKTRLLPLVIVSDQDQEAKVIRALDMGVNDYIRRPIERNELLARMATQVRRKCYNLLLRDSVQQTIEMAVTDSMTGLNNRRYLDNHLPGMMSKAATRNTPLSLILCDIDLFKAVNDEHGHDVGDEVIVEFARRIRKNVRNIDLACRFGGEEFIIAMPETDLSLARVVAERIRNEVAAHPFVVEQGAKQLPITVSLGVATLEGDDDTPEKLIKRADMALYQAKRGGRNRVIFEAA